MIQHSLERALSSDQLPTLPEVAVNVIQISKQSDPDMRELVEVIRADGAIAGRILKFANSALFGVRKKPSSIETAVPMLGTTMVRTLVLGLTLSKMGSETRELKEAFQQLWRESLAQASAAEFIAAKVPNADPPTWFLAGLLQDVGRLAMLSTLEQEYVDNVMKVRDGRSVTEREFDYVGFTHVDVSVGLCQRWNLDESIIDAISLHHKSVDEIADDNDPVSDQLPVGLITASRCCEYLEDITKSIRSARHDVEKLLILEFGYRPDEVFRMLADVDERVNELAAAFSINVGSQPSREQLLERAQAALVDIAMRSHIARLTSNVTGRVLTVEDTWNHSEPGNIDDEQVSLEANRWFDQASGVYTEGFLAETLPGELRRAHEADTSTAFLMITFSEVHDGECEQQKRDDKMFREIAEVVKSSVRPTDSVIRYGQTGFVVLVPGLNIDLLSRIAVHLNAEISDIEFEQLTDCEIQCSVNGLVHIPAGRKVVDTGIVLGQVEKLIASRNEQFEDAVSMTLMHGKKCRQVPIPDVALQN